MVPYILYSENPIRSCNSGVRNFQLLFRNTCCCWNCVTGHQGSAYVKIPLNTERCHLQKKFAFFFHSVFELLWGPKSKLNSGLVRMLASSWVLLTIQRTVLFLQVVSTLYRHQVHLCEQDFPEVWPDSPQDGIHLCLSSTKSAYLYRKEHIVNP